MVGLSLGFARDHTQFSCVLRGSARSFVDDDQGAGGKSGLIFFGPSLNWGLSFPFRMVSLTVLSYCMPLWAFSVDIDGFKHLYSRL